MEFFEEEWKYDVRMCKCADLKNVQIFKSVRIASNFKQNKKGKLCIDTLYHPENCKAPLNAQMQK